MTHLIAALIGAWIGSGVTLVVVCCCIISGEEETHEQT